MVGILLKDRPHGQHAPTRIGIPQNVADKLQSAPKALICEYSGRVKQVHRCQPHHEVLETGILEQRSPLSFCQWAGTDSDRLRQGGLDLALNFA
jgi:hypothetical protein